MDQAIPLELRPYARLDPRRVRRGLSRAAPVKPDDLLAAIDRQLLERIGEIRFTPETILELGRTPGAFIRALQKEHPKARVISLGIAPPREPLKPTFRLPWKPHPLAITGDPIRLPFPSDHFDLVVSNMMLHWSSDPLATLRETRRVLKPGAPLLLATMGQGSLTELQQALAIVDQARFGRVWIRVPEFPALQELGDLMASAGFTLAVADREVLRPQLPDVHTLLAELRRMGATNAHHQRPSALMGKGYPHALNTCYRTHHGAEDGSIPATLEILFGHAWKKSASPRTEDSIRR